MLPDVKISTSFWSSIFFQFYKIYHFQAASLLIACFYYFLCFFSRKKILKSIIGPKFRIGWVMLIQQLIVFGLIVKKTR